MIAGDMPEVSTAVAIEMLRVAADVRRSEAVALQDGDRFRPVPLALRVAPRHRSGARDCATTESTGCAPCLRRCAPR